MYFFEAVAPPFGSISSVLAFNRAARALRMILARLFKLVGGGDDFFDDFCQLELSPLAGGAWKGSRSSFGVAWMAHIDG